MFYYILSVILPPIILCELALNKSILHRKISLFFKTEHGSYIGDLFMGLIDTYNLCKVNPFEYLKTFQKHSSELFHNTDQWMPWNYEESIITAADLLNLMRKSNLHLSLTTEDLKL